MFERTQLLDALAYGFEISGGDLVGLAARPLWMIGEFEQRADVWKFEAQGAGMPDESEAPYVGVGVEPTAACRPGRGSDQAFLLIKADGWDPEAGLFALLLRYLALPLDPLVARGCSPGSVSLRESQCCRPGFRSPFLALPSRWPRTSLGWSAAGCAPLHTVLAAHEPD